MTHCIQLCTSRRHVHSLAMVECFNVTQAASRLAGIAHTQCVPRVHHHCVMMTLPSEPAILRDLLTTLAVENTHTRTPLLHVFFLRSSQVTSEKLMETCKELSKHRMQMQI
mmetsp:Transcript_34837/g.48495  ORF Transcript_34837/g.48495 Transcript_34837/m.48495 type:complete len:111 (+) Transcript_34837:124-456(+)